MFAINGDDDSFGFGDYKLTERPPGHHAGRPDRPARPRRPFNPLNLRPWYWTALGDGPASCCSSTSACATRGWGARGSPSARTRWRRRRWASRSSRPSCWPTRPARRFGGMAGRLPRRLLQHGQRRPVPVRVLDLHAGDDHPRRPGLDLGGRDRRDHCCRYINTLLDPGRAQRRAVARSGWTSTSPSCRSGSSASCS